MNLMRYLRTPLDLPIALFLVSALIGVWASYDPATSWRKFAMIVAAVVLYYLLISMRAAQQLLETFVWLLLFGCCALTIYFTTQHDYAAQPGKFGFITAIGLSLNRVAPPLGLHVFDPNITSGALEIGLPIAIAIVVGQTEQVKRRSDSRLSPGLLVSLSACAVIAFGLVMTSSRGAWLALGIVGGIAVLAIAAKEALRRYALPIGVILTLMIIITLLLLRDAFVPALETILGTIPAGATAVSRVELWGQAWGLVQDYVFTGNGLGVFPMILSTYALFIDVPFLTHAHNLLLQVWLEQGILGFVAFLWLVFAFYCWTWKRRHSLDWLGWGSVAAATVLLLHGMVDVLLYSSRGLPMLLVPFGLTFASRQSTVDSQQMEEQRTQNTECENKTWNRKTVTWNSRLGVVFLAACSLLILSSFILHPSSLLSLWYANIGSVEQTRVELGQYRWPDRLVGDVRRSCQSSEASCSLNQAERSYQRALHADAQNVTANQRLAAIALARGSYEDAQAMLSLAHMRDPSNKVTDRLLSLVLAR